jgi:hypothetical protein
VNDNEGTQMSVLPTSKKDKIKFVQDHLTIWADNAVAIGTTAAAVTALQAKKDAAQAALTAQGEAQNAAKSRTNDLNIAVQAMVDATTDILKQIKTQAALTGPTVYSLADIPVPATPSPKPAPGQPTDFKVALGALGEVNLSWKCANPPGSQGTIYQIWRRLGTETEAKYLGGVGKKEFTDATVPAGTSTVVYQIQASRSTKNGPWATYTVQFGVSGGGATIASVTETPGPKIAA